MIKKPTYEQIRYLKTLDNNIEIQFIDDGIQPVLILSKISCIGKTDIQQIMDIMKNRKLGYNIFIDNREGKISLSIHFF